MTRSSGKTDANHAEIRDGLRQIFGTDAVQDVARHRGLGFDLIAHVHGRIRFLEVKQPRKATHLTESETAARERYGRHWRVVTTLREAIDVVQEEI